MYNYTYIYIVYRHDKYRVFLKLLIFLQFPATGKDIFHMTLRGPTTKILTHCPFVNYNLDTQQIRVIAWKQFILAMYNCIALKGPLNNPVVQFKSATYLLYLRKYT